MAAEVTQAEYLASVRTAHQNVLDGLNDSVDADARARADAANVRSVEFIEYAAALSNYEARSDVEPLAERRAREAATTFAAQDFARSETYFGGQDDPAVPAS